MLNKKVLAAAVIGGLFAGNAAAADFTAGAPSSAAYAATVGKYAKEIKIDTAAGTAFAASAGNEIIWELGQNLSPGEVKYNRIEAAPHVEFGAAAPSTTAADPSGAVITYGSVNGIGTNVLTFSITAAPANATGDDTAATEITLPANFALYALQGSDVKVSMYDTASQAQQGGTTGLNTFGSYEGAYFTFADSLRWISTPATVTADVGANPSYTTFVGGALSGTINTGLGVATITGGTLTAGGAAVNLGTLLDLANTSVTIAGDFSFIRANNGATAYSGALARASAFGVNPTAGNLSADAAKFVLGGAYAGAAAPVTLGAKSNTASFNPLINVSDYTASLNAAQTVAISAAYNAPVLAPRVIGDIDRNGLTLQAPLVQTPENWISRMVLTNTSSVDRPYTITVLTEAGVTATNGTLSGVIPANSIKVIDDLKTVFTTNGAPRGTLVVDIASRNNDVQGLYQIVNPEKGSISNHVMVRAGTN